MLTSSYHLGGKCQRGGNGISLLSVIRGRGHHVAACNSLPGGESQWESSTARGRRRGDLSLRCRKEEKLLVEDSPKENGSVGGADREGARSQRGGVQKGFMLLYS